MKFSVVVIGFNQKNTILAAIDSILNQSWKDLEVIFVDDASTDGCAAFVEDHYKDSRLRLIRHEQNKGPFISRLDGVDNASGDYVLFLDGDDSYAPNTCAVLAGKIEKTMADLIGFGTEMVYTTAVEQNIRTDIENLMCVPCLGKMSGDELCRKTFIEKQMSHVVWNKCYSIALARRISQTVVHDVLMLNEDYYFSFVAASLAERYVGIADQLYRYSFGEGISTAKKLSFPAFERSLTAYKANCYCWDYAEKKGTLEEYRQVLEKNRLDGLYSVYTKLAYLPEEWRFDAARLMFDTYGVEYVNTILPRYFWWNYKENGEKLDVGRLFPVRRDRIRTVAMFYHRIYNGGVERVVSLLSNILSQNGYRLVVITDDEVNPKDFPLPEGTVRLVIGDPEEGKAFGERHRKWISFIERYDIDAVVYHAWLSPAMIWDMCAIKSTGAAFITHSHNIFIAGLNEGWTGVQECASVLRHSDAFAVLSEADRLYWSRFGERVFRVNNPLTFSPRDIPAATLEGHNILWLGRFDYGQKNPSDPLWIMKQVKQYVPDAKLYMVGGIDEKKRGEFNATISELGLTDNVFLPGYSTNVQEWFQKSAVFLMTPNYEGYNMTLAESLANGVPVVTYELKYMTMSKNSGAVVHVPWRNIEAAADALVSLLLDGDKRKAMGQAAREEIMAFDTYDYAAVWAGIFESALSGKPNAEAFEPTAVKEMMYAADLASLQMCKIIQYHTQEYYPPPADGFALVVRKIKTLFRVMKNKGFKRGLCLIRDKLLRRQNG